MIFFSALTGKHRYSDNCNCFKCNKCFRQEAEKAIKRGEKKKRKK